MEIISSITHEIIKDNNECVVLEDGQVVIRNKSNDELLLLSVQHAEETFGIKLKKNYKYTCSGIDPLPENEPSTSSTSSTQWSRDNIKLLISCYTRFENEFKSTKIKNETVWKKIANEIGCYTSKQCSDKFKYLKQKYIKKKDNMGSHDSGAAHYKFEYFNEFDEIFGKKANVLPIAIASSLKGDTIHETNDDHNEDEHHSNGLEIPPAKKQKISKKGANFVGKLLEHFKEENETKEANRQRRHEERLAAYNNKMDALLKKF